MTKNNTMLALIMTLLFGTTLLLSACNTAAGAGKDISNTGRVITNEANEHAP